MQKYILSLDQRTACSQAIIYNREGEIISSSRKELEQLYPNAGWIEHDPNEIWFSQAAVAAEAVSKANINGKLIEAIGISNQRETTILWDKETGEPVYNAIVWQDRRTHDYINKLKGEGVAELVKEKTGLVLDSYFSASKIWWIIQNVEGVRERAIQGKIAFGTIDSWLLWKFTKGAVHITDTSNASRTMLFNIHDCLWDIELLEIFDIPIEIMPEIKSSCEVYAESFGSLFASRIPISSIMGNQSASLFGQNCMSKGDVKNTFGSGCFLSMNTGQEVIMSKNNLISSVAWTINGKTSYSLEGSVFGAESVIRWLRDGLGIIQSRFEIGELADTVENNGGVYIVPSFNGLGAPYWDQNAQGVILGLSNDTNSGHIARAVLEGVSLRSMEVLLAMEKDANIQIKELKVDGSISVISQLLQIQSDILQIPLIRSDKAETSALGAAMMAGLSVGYWKNIDELRSIYKVSDVFTPKIEVDRLNLIRKKWRKAIERARFWDVS
ncbi:MAG: glycerol kinase GlpK [Bacteroidales bacterium]